MKVQLPSLSVILGALCAAASLGAQAPDRDRLVAALDRDIWLPWLLGIHADSAPLYVGVHARDFHWVAPGATGRIMDLAEYEEDSRMVMRRRRESGERIHVEIRFLERNVTPGLAAEKAVTRVVRHRPGQAPDTSYGVAHYFSRREQGVWRVFLRYGSSERGHAEAFEGAEPLTPLPGAVHSPD